MSRFISETLKSRDIKTTGETTAIQKQNLCRRFINYASWSFQDGIKYFGNIPVTALKQSSLYFTVKFTLKPTLLMDKQEGVFFKDGGKLDTLNRRFGSNPVYLIMRKGFISRQLG